MAYFIAENIKYLRKKSGKTQSDIAFQVNKASNTIGNWETYISEPSIKEIEILAHFFDVNPADFIFTDLAKGNLMGEGQKHQKGNLKGNPNGNLMPQNDQEKPSKEGGNIPEIMKLLVESKDLVIKSQQVTIDTLNNLLGVKNQEIEKISEENTRLKRAVPEVGRDVEGRSGEGSKKNIA